MNNVLASCARSATTKLTARSCLSCGNLRFPQAFQGKNQLEPCALRFSSASSAAGATDAKTAAIRPNQLHYKIGQIVRCEKHPLADKLYVSRVATSPAAAAAAANDPSATSTEGLITVCSGLRDYIPLSELQGRKVVLISNLKASKMRGVKSEAMLLAAEKKTFKNGASAAQTSIAEETRGAEVEAVVNVELVSPPLGSAVGANLVFKPLSDFTGNIKVEETGTENASANANANPATPLFKKIKDAKKLAAVLDGLRTNDAKFVSFVDNGDTPAQERGIEYFLVDPVVEAKVEAEGFEGAEEDKKKQYVAFADMLSGAVVR